VFVAVQSIQRIRTTAEGHRRIAIIEVMGRQSGFIALGSAYGQPDVILIPEVALDTAHLVERVIELYELQKHAVIVVGEGIVDESGNELGSISKSVDPAGNIIFSGAAEQLQSILMKSIGSDYFKKRRPHESPESAIFTRKIGHTQRGGRPVRFDRFYAGELGAKAVELLATGSNNVMATLQWSQQDGFTLDSLPANKLRDHYGVIHPRLVHPSFYDARRFRPSKLGVQYMLPIFSNAIGTDDMECMRTGMFSPGNLVTRYQSVNTDILKKTRYLAAE
ncbi:MAG: 6-phosphofructokinase, partial [Planctomycetaceae bacterium]